MTQKPMTKTQLVAAIAESAAMDKASANRALDALTEIVTKEVSTAAPLPCPALESSPAAPGPSAWCATPRPASR